MSPEAIKDLIRQGEGISIEFKSAGFKLPKSTLESVCSMLNREGGHLLLGVNDDGEIEGVSEESIQDIKSDFATSVNDQNQLNPKYYLNLHEVEIDGMVVLYTYIPESSQVHSHKGKVYNRNEDGDFSITNNPDLVRQLHLTKQGSFSENTIYPAIKITDLRQDLIHRSRTLANNNKPGHLWMEMNDQQMLRSANLWKKDWKTGKEGFTLAAALLLGKDELILNILPHYKTDALLIRNNKDRYDDRELVRTNLIESYDRLMGFISKHLPDKFHMEGDQRISLRDKIFREVIANTLIHREYFNEYPGRVIIDEKRVFIENWNRPHGSGKLRLDTYTPFPKNPIIASFYREIGRAEELGSGFRNSTRYSKLYADGAEPDFEEGDVFKIAIPVISQADPAIDPANKIVSVENNQTEGAKSEVEGVIEEVIKGVSGPVRQRLVEIVLIVLNEPGIKNIDLQKRFNISERTVTSDMNRLKRFIQYKGSRKGGGYEPSNELINRIGR